VRRVTLGLGISHGLLVAPGIPLVLHDAPQYSPSLHLASLSSTKYQPERLFVPQRERSAPFRARRAALRSPGDNRARRRSSSAQCGNQRSKHVGAVNLPDSVGEGGIGSFVTEKTVDGVVG
jgi:hypothetical protein